MAELLVALAPLLVLAGLALVALFVPVEALAVGALALMAVGLVLGLPTGLYYHVLLRRELTAHGPAPAGWYWRPQKHHSELAPPARRRLMPWFWLGALGFLLICTGFCFAVTALMVHLRTERAMLP